MCRKKHSERWKRVKEAIKRICGRNWKNINGKIIYLQSGEIR